MTALSVRHDWDLDDVGAGRHRRRRLDHAAEASSSRPVVAGIHGVTPVLAAVWQLVSILCWSSAGARICRCCGASCSRFRCRARGDRQHARGSHHRGQPRFAPRVPALLVVIPPLLSLSGSLAGILSSRLASGSTSASWSRSAARLARDHRRRHARVRARPASSSCSRCATELLSGLLSLNAPSVGQLVGTILLADSSPPPPSRAFVGYFGALVTYRYGLDPDNYGIPLVSSASDLLGAVSLILSLVVFRLT